MGKFVLIVVRASHYSWKEDEMNTIVYGIGNVKYKLSLNDLHKIIRYVYENSALKEDGYFGHDEIHYALTKTVLTKR